MTDEEITAALKKADELLETYKETVKPVVEELAKRKSMAVYGVEDRYSGDLGCYEEGVNCLCLHLKEHGALYEEDRQFHDKAIDFDIELHKKVITDNRIRNIYLKGHF